MLHHLAEGDVVDVDSPSDFDVELAVEDAKLQSIHQTAQLQLAEHTVELRGRERVASIPGQHACFTFTTVDLVRIGHMVC